MLNLYRLLFPSKWAHHERSKVSPNGFLFLRNYKKSHESRVKKAIDLMELDGRVSIVNQAFDNKGTPLPLKLAIYVSTQETEALFFQGYSTVKANEKK